MSIRGTTQLTLLRKFLKNLSGQHDLLQFYKYRRTYVLLGKICLFRRATHSSVALTPVGGLGPVSELPGFGHLLRYVNYAAPAPGLCLALSATETARKT